ncbi:hypothetical protein D3C78_1538500 [compost metagenome]
MKNRRALHRNIPSEAAPGETETILLFENQFDPLISFDVDRVMRLLVHFGKAHYV